MRRTFPTSSNCMWAKQKRWRWPAVFSSYRVSPCSGYSPSARNHRHLLFILRPSPCATWLVSAPSRNQPGKHLGIAVTYTWVSTFLVYSHEARVKRVSVSARLSHLSTGSAQPRATHLVTSPVWEHGALKTPVDHGNYMAGQSWS